ncbi:Uma2 family endonuclease [Spiractinospora alimapuensis]|uniref:Uma2 family endonuclease n=1 Tax=Spiractinospora alimapuensis TaxID=2820884 RepID=UPI001F198337|nr:Uma2 family endonuclease [Spiractinospora alimapuensis]QVQ49994.1 Uma2 family endonuclease [Spiractinospora alimapuensis]
MRAVADRLADVLPTGFRVEVLGGSLVASPAPSNKHNGVVRRVMLQVERQLTPDRMTYQVSSVGFGGDDGDLAIPDLVVLPSKAEEEDEWLNSPDVVEFVLEVASPGNPATDVTVKPQVYASMGIPIYLLIDPRRGSAVCRSDPRDGRYQGIHHFRYGAVIPLPDPLEDVRIETDALPRYT